MVAYFDDNFNIDSGREIETILNMGLVGVECERCTNCAAVKDALEDRPEPWLIRCLATGNVWRNPALASMFDVDRTDTWTRALRLCAAPDVPRVEDACSRCMKLNGVEVLDINAKILPHQHTRMSVAFKHIPRVDGSPGVIIASVIS